MKEKVMKAEDLATTQKAHENDALRFHSEIMNNLSEGIYLIRLEDGIIVYTNPKFEEMFGYDPGEMIGKHVSIVNAPTGKDPEETAGEIIAILNKTGTWRGEIENIRKDGTRFWCYANVSLFDHAGYGRVTVSVHTDITERKKAEEMLKKKTDEQRLLLDNIDTQIWYMTDVETYGAVNKAHEKFIGLKQKELEGKSLYSLISKEAADICIAVNKELFEKNKQIKTEEWAINSKGEKRLLAITKTPGINDRGEVEFIVSTAEDITERKRAEEALKVSESELRKQKESLEQKNMALRELVEQIDIEKNRIREDIAININNTLKPILSMIKVDSKHAKIIDLLKSHLDEIAASFGRRITEKSYNLTTREIGICNMIKGGLRTKDICDLLGISPQTVENHRQNIRKKLKISNKKVNLASFLHNI